MGNIPEKREWVFSITKKEWEIVCLYSFPWLNNNEKWGEVNWIVNNNEKWGGVSWIVNNNEKWRGVSWIGNVHSRDPL